MPLVSATQIAALRTVAYKGLETPISILRKETVENAYGSEEMWVEVSDTLGWVREMSTTKAGEMLTFIGTTGTFRLHVEADVDIRPGDTVGIEGTIFTVSDTNSDNTIRVFTTAIMRRVE
jgi:hypothetical protein